MALIETSVAQQLYEVTARIVRVIDYGITLDAVLSGQAPPPEGARFDIVVEGRVHGPALSGTLNAIDYLHVRADGRQILHIHGEIATDDGARVSVFADGVSLPDQGAPTVQLRENVTLTTSFPNYAWLNRLQLWGRGTVDLAQQQIQISVFTL